MRLDEIAVCFAGINPHVKSGLVVFRFMQIPGAYICKMEKFVYLAANRFLQLRIKGQRRESVS